jgi:hypothetical protein
MEDVPVIMSRDQWQRLVELAQMGADYDADGCDYPAKERKSAADCAMMDAFDTLKAKLG